MTEEEFKQWLEFVNDVDLEDAAYAGLVTLPAEVEKLKSKITELTNYLATHSTWYPDSLVKELIREAQEAL